MNPELFKIALENKAIVDAIKLHMAKQKVTVISTPSNTKSSGIAWKIMLFAGVAVVGYDVYNKY